MYRELKKTANWRMTLTKYLYCSNRAGPFRDILEFQLAWVLNFCIWQKKWEIQTFCEIGPHLLTAPEAILDRAAPKYTNIDKNRTISARYSMLVFIFNAF